MNLNLTTNALKADVDRLLRGNLTDRFVSKVTVRKSWKRTLQQAAPTAISGNRQRLLRPRK